jgi:YD repeat-containing protein
MGCRSGEETPSLEATGAGAGSEVAAEAVAVAEPLECVVRTDTSSEDHFGSETTWRQDAEGRWTRYAIVSDGPVLGARWRYEGDSVFVQEDEDEVGHGAPESRLSAVRSADEIVVEYTREFGSYTLTVQLDAQGRPIGYDITEEGEWMRGARCERDVAGHLTQVRSVVSPEPNAESEDQTDYEYDDAGRLVSYVRTRARPVRATVRYEENAVVVAQTLDDEDVGEITFTTTHPGPCRRLAEPRCVTEPALPPGWLDHVGR